MNNLLLDKIRIAICFAFLLPEGILDKRKKKILLWPVIVCLPLGILLGFLEGKEDGIFSLLGMAVGVLFLGLAFITKEKIGYGDGLVIAVTGVLLGFKWNLITVMLALFLAALKSIWLLISRKGNRNTKVAFVPFLLPALTLSIALMGRG